MRLCRECRWCRNGVCQAMTIPNPRDLRVAMINQRFLDHVVQEPSCTQWLVEPRPLARRKIAP